MSVKIMSRVWDESIHNGTALLMLLAIADHANDDGLCWPSVATLAAKARVQERQAQNLIAQLIESGELTVRRGHGRRNTSIYVVAIGEKGAIQREINRAEKVQSSVKKVQSSALKGAIAIAPDPLEPIAKGDSIHSPAVDADRPRKYEPAQYAAITIVGEDVEL